MAVQVVRVLALCRYNRLGASSRLRTLQYLPALRERGFTVTLHTLFEDKYLEALYGDQEIPIAAILGGYSQRIRYLLTSKAFDLIWIEKEALPWVPAWVERLLIRTPYVIDMDDAVFHRYDRHSRAWVRALLGRKFNRLLSGASIVVAGNRYLAEQAEKMAADVVRIIPTSVDTDRYQPSKRALGGFVVGWIGTPLTARFLVPLKSVLQRLQAECGVKYRFIGAPPSLPLGVNYEAVPWSESTEVEELQRLDCGIMPLPDEPFERGKSAYKLIQYMACGLPVVASPVGANCDVVLDGESGFLAKSQKDWFSAVQRLTDDRDLAESMGRVGRERVLACYSTQVALENISDCWLRSIRSQLT